MKDTQDVSGPAGLVTCYTFFTQLSSPYTTCDGANLVPILQMRK